MATLGTKPLFGGLVPADVDRVPDGYGSRSVYQTASDALTLTGTPTRVPNLFYVPLRAGTWFVLGSCDFDLPSNSTGPAAVCRLEFNGSTFGTWGVVRFRTGSGGQAPSIHRQSITTVGICTGAANGVIELMAYINAGTGGTATTHSRMMVVPVA